MGKTRHREYMDAILQTKERIIVDSDYSPFMVGRALMNEPKNIFLVHLGSQLMGMKVSTQGMDRSEIRKQRLHEKQRHFDLMLNMVEQKETLPDRLNNKVK